MSSLIAPSGRAPITVGGRMMQADMPLRITGQNLTVDISGAAIDPGAQAPVWLIRVVHARNVALMNAKTTADTNRTLADSGSNIDGHDVGGPDRKRRCRNGVRWPRRHHARRPRSEQRPLQGNDMRNLLGPSNLNAAILLTSRGGGIGVDLEPSFRATVFGSSGVQLSSAFKTLTRV